VSRGSTAFEIFQIGGSSVETVLGESSDLGIRMAGRLFSEVHVIRWNQREYLGD